MRGATISDRGEYLRADLIHQHGGAQLEKFLDQLAVALRAHGSGRLLLYAHVSRATRKIEKYHGSRFIERLAAKPSVKVALVATHREVQLVQQYVEALARMKKASLRSFIDEAAALAWLLPRTTTTRAVRSKPRPPR